MDDFVRKLEKIELPNQVISVLSDPLLQKYLALKPSEAATARMDHWLSTFFEEELRSMGDGQQDPTRLSSVLDSLLSYARYTKVSCSHSCSHYS